MAKRSFGRIDKRKSDKYRARYVGPDGELHSAPVTFTTIGDAHKFLARVQTEISQETWVPPGTVAPTAPILRTYADAWVKNRTTAKGEPLAIRTKEEYEGLLRLHVYPTFGDDEITAITPAAVRVWHARDAAPTPKAAGYSLFKSILTTAVEDEIIAVNPCRVRGGGAKTTKKKVVPLTLDELALVLAALPARYRAMALIATWCSMRFGELAGLQRGDLDTKAGLAWVRRAKVRTRSGPVMTTTKSRAGIRKVTIPWHIIPDLEVHLRDHVPAAKSALLFPAATSDKPLASSTFARILHKAGLAAGRDDVTPHVMRHTGQSWSALMGANLPELMARGGQSTAQAALVYLHEVDGRQQEIADRLADYGTGESNVTPIRTLRQRRSTEGS